MPRSLRPLVLAAVVGSALTIGVIGLMSMTQVLPAGQHVIVSYGPSPRDMVQIAYGAPYVVPVGRVLVLTGLGDAYGFGNSSLMVNGNIVATVTTGCSNGGGSSINALPVGLTAPAGSTVELGGAGTNTSARAWGFLADQ